MHIFNNDINVFFFYSVHFNNWKSYGQI